MNAAMSTSLLQRLLEQIDRDGPISVADYVAACLTDPDHGYYVTQPAIGRAGDFITAPEISQMFGELIGLWAVGTWRQLALPEPVRLVEFGPGRGTLMADALRAIARAVPALADALEVALVEASPGMRDQQKARLAGSPVTWHDGLDSVAAGPAIFIANEFFDALPIHQYVKQGAAWHERRVGREGTGDALCFVTDPAPATVTVPLPSAGDGAVAETCPAATAIVEQVCRRLRAQSGALLIIDYGPSESATGNSLQAVRNHRFHPVLSDPGQADITAHVDFASLAAVAGRAGMTVSGPMPQRAFLQGLGIDLRLQRLLANADANQREQLISGHRRLTDRAEMGDLFKVMAITDSGSSLPPFAEP
jgi:NADH dehydrogenase [ubiquinone] 1 alpha subcomplex assembly factor 7